MSYVSQVKNGTSFLGVGHSLMVLSHHEVTDLSIPVYPLKVRLVSRKPEPLKQQYFNIMRPFDVTSWIFALISLVAVCAFGYLSGLANSFFWHGKWRSEAGMVSLLGMYGLFFSQCEHHSTMSCC